MLPPGNVRDRDPNKAKEQPSFDVADVPPHIDYEKWLGPAPLKPYIPARLHYNWRWNFDYSGGVLTDWASHLVNLAQWANNTDDSGPIEVQGTGKFPDFAEPWNTAETFNIHYRYANGVTLNVWSEVPGIKFEGTKGWIMIRGWRQGLRASDDALLGLVFEGDKNLGRPESTVKAGDGGRGGEHLDFTNCVKSRKLCYYSAECGHRNHTISHIGNISMLLGGAKLSWNPKTEKFEGERADEANAPLLLRPRATRAVDLRERRFVDQRGVSHGRTTAGERVPLTTCHSPHCPAAGTNLSTGRSARRCSGVVGCRDEARRGRRPWAARPARRGEPSGGRPTCGSVPG